ncbi:hypothetical protein [Neobacillus citreus]|uniref:Uncharacterized protein n=1 Tax=Neobacillus citreus TaxID=2833578 RepID=A0A9J6MLN1_9BACI|nr:hypothetical protein [Neobacillus citreus]MCH6264913.1 hypothetical protein [Neobacillus citreus]
MKHRTLLTEPGVITIVNYLRVGTAVPLAVCEHTEYGVNPDTKYPAMIIIMK